MEDLEYICMAINDDNCLIRKIMKRSFHRRQANVR